MKLNQIIAWFEALRKNAEEVMGLNSRRMDLLNIQICILFEEKSLLRIRDQLLAEILKEVFQKRFLFVLEAEEPLVQDVMEPVKVLFERKLTGQKPTQEEWLQVATAARTLSRSDVSQPASLLAQLANRLAMAQWAMFPEALEQVSQDDYEAVSQGLGSDYALGAFMGSQATMTAMMEGRDAMEVAVQLFGGGPEGRKTFYEWLAQSLGNLIIAEDARLLSELA